MTIPLLGLEDQQDSTLVSDTTATTTTSVINSSVITVVPTIVTTSTTTTITTATLTATEDNRPQRPAQLLDNNTLVENATDDTENVALHTDVSSDMEYDDNDSRSEQLGHAEWNTDSADDEDELSSDNSGTDSSLDDDEEMELQHLAEQDEAMHDISDESEIDDEHGELAYWAKRCSICFDARMDISLVPCRDQYCHQCLERYVTEVVMSSWGLDVTTLKCPVCLQPISKSDWSKLVPQSVVDHYDRFNQPYRSFTRCCPQCEKESKPCDRSLKVNGVDYLKRIKDLMRSLMFEDYNGQVQKVDGKNEGGDPMTGSDVGNCRQIYTALRCLLARLGNENTAASLLDIYCDTLKTLSTVEQAFATNSESSSSTVSERCHAIYSAFTLLDIAPEMWKEIQFIYITHFPVTICDQCHLEFCLRCGYEAHGELDCEDAMRQLIDLDISKDNDKISMARWYLNNSRRCPSCAIMIDRNEGCNRVDCSLCGFCFCWVCRQPWSEKCGFFLCQEVEDPNLEAIPKSTESGTGQKGSSDSRNT